MTLGLEVRLSAARGLELPADLLANDQKLFLEYAAYKLSLVCSDYMSKAANTSESQVIPTIAEC